MYSCCNSLLNWVFQLDKIFCWGLVHRYQARSHAWIKGGGGCCKNTEKPNRSKNTFTKNQNGKFILSQWKFQREHFITSLMHFYFYINCFDLQNAQCTVSGQPCFHFQRTFFSKRQDCCAEEKHKENEELIFSKLIQFQPFDFF